MRGFYSIDNPVSCIVFIKEIAAMSHLCRVQGDTRNSRLAGPHRGLTMGVGGESPNRGDDRSIWVTF